MLRYSGSHLSEIAPKLVNIINSAAARIQMTRLDDEDLNFLVNSMERKLGSDARRVTFELKQKLIVPIFDTNLKKTSHIIVPFFEDGTIKTAFNLYPYFSSIDKIDNLTTVLKFATDAMVQRRIYVAPKKFTTNNDFSNVMVEIYQEMYLSIFRKFVTFNDKKDIEDAIAFVTRYYVLAVLLDKPEKGAIDKALMKLPNRSDPSVVTSIVPETELNSIKDFSSFMNTVNTVILEQPVSEKQFAKEFALLQYPTVAFGLDMFNVLAGGLYGYVVANAYVGDYIKLTKGILDKKISRKLVKAIDNLL